jgi:hypothetical protein
LRAISIVLLAWMLWLSLDRDRTESVVSAGTGNLDAALDDWSRSGIAPNRIAVELDSTPSPEQRDWLRALRGAGSEVTWSGDLPPVAVATRGVPAPNGGITVLAASKGEAQVRIFDAIGPLDTADSRGGGAAFTIPSADEFVAARAGGSTARAPLPDSVTLRRLLVLGSAGWESKFVVAALEEAGWSVDASIYVAPGVSVTQGAASPIDTSRYSAVIALDGAASSRAGEIIRYVTSGGGLLLSGAAASIEAFASVRPAAPGRILAPVTLDSEGAPTTLASLGVIPAASLRPDAIVLERRGAAAITSARRHVAGRVLQQGHLETWRWRMSGRDKSVEDHRDWWTRSVASVAFAPTVRSSSDAAALDPAPVAGLVGALGASSAARGPGLASAAASISLWWLAAALALCLLGEWSSRRLRGMR